MLLYFPQAFADLIEEMDWTTYVIIYEDEESLVRLQVNE